MCLYDSITDEATMPDFLDKTVWGGTIAEEKAAGLPNIEGMLQMQGVSNRGNINGFFAQNDNDGFTSNVGNGATYGATIYVSAQNSNPIYGNSTTVQPPAISLIPQIRYKKEVLKGSLGDIYDDTPVGTVISFMVIYYSYSFCIVCICLPIF